MTVVLITGNLINQFKCLITTAWLKAEHKGSRCDVDESQKETGEQKANSQHFSVETRGVGAVPGGGKSWGPTSPRWGLLREDCWLMREWSSPLKLLEPRPPLGPESTQRLGLPVVGTVGVGGGTGRACCGPGPGRSRMTRPLCLSQRGPASHTAVPRGHNARLKSKTSRDTELFLPAAPSPRSIPSQDSVQGTDSACDAAPSSQPTPVLPPLEAQLGTPCSRS